jgi:hypothetical protein
MRFLRKIAQIIEEYTYSEHEAHYRTTFRVRQLHSLVTDPVTISLVRVLTKQLLPLEIYVLKNCGRLGRNAAVVCPGDLIDAHFDRVA